MSLSIRAFFVALFATIKRWKLVFFFYLFGFATSAFLVIPVFHASLSDFAGRQEFMDRDRGVFDPGLLADLLYEKADLFEVLLAGAGIGGIAYFLIHNLLTGGLVVILADPRERTTLKTFFKACGRFAFRFLRLLFYAALGLVLLALINLVLNRGLLWYFHDYMEHGAGSSALGWFLFGKNIFMLLLLCFVLLAFNYGKASAVVEDRHFMGGSLMAGMGFVLAHPLVTGLFFLFSLLPLLGTIQLYLVLSRRLDLNGEYRVLEAFGGVTISGALVYFLLAQGIQLLIQGCLVLRHAGQIYILKYLTVRSSHPDPELARPDLYSPFIPDRPYAGPEDSKHRSHTEEHDHV